MQVLVGNSVSEAVSIPFSVPQGSCVGQVLYNKFSSTMGKLTQSYLVNLKVKVKVMDLYSTFQTGYALPKVLYM